MPTEPQAESPSTEAGDTLPEVEPDSDLVWAREFCEVNGYGPPKLFGDGRWAAVYRRMFNARLIVGEIGDESPTSITGGTRNVLSAAAALEVWDGAGEPVGWFRHAATGRRFSRSASELDNQLNPVGAVGVTYVMP